MDPCEESSSSISDDEDDGDIPLKLSREADERRRVSEEEMEEEQEERRSIKPRVEDDPRKDFPIRDDGDNRIVDEIQLENDKKEVYNHPLFPLLALLLEKCEQATAALGTNDDFVISGESFNSEIKAIIQQQQKDDRPLLGKNTEVDSLMIKAIQVLRIHLLELEKVQELCKDFCLRYIRCLRTKMNSENLLRGTAIQDNADGSFDNSSCSSHSSDECSSEPSNFSMNDANVSAPTDFPAAIAQDLSRNNLPEPMNDRSDGSKSNASEASENQPQDLVMNRALNLAPRIDSGNEGDLSDDASSTAQKRNQKRGILPKQATSVMRSWLFQHIVHPYPTEDEKRAIAAQTNLTLLQVNNWFINARRRILQPMLDSANINNNNNTTNPSSNNNNNNNNGSVGGGGNNSSQSITKEVNAAKKLKTSNKNSTFQRFWPESIANAIKVAANTTKDAPRKYPS